MFKAYKILCVAAFGLLTPAVFAAESAPARPAALAPAQTAALDAQYIYLATTRHLIEGVTPDLLDGLRAVSRTAITRYSAPQNTDSLDKKLNDPILLQADPAAIVGMATSVIELGIDRGDDIEAALSAIEDSQPQFASLPLALAILENGVRFRFALAQALYAVDLRELPRPQQDAVERYIEGTYDLRDEMEVLEFEIAVDGMTDEAIDQQSSAYAALQRGIIAEIDPYSFEADAKRARQMSEQARAGIAAEMRGMYLQLLLLVAISLP